MQADRKLMENEYELCRRSKIHFINNWGQTYDPREMPKHFPFELYEFQTEAISWITQRYTNKENGLIEKSRDMGVTWLIAAWAAHEWLFGHGFTALFGSRKQDLVDDMTMDSIFGKLRYFIYRLPPFLKPEMKQRTKHDRYLTLINPDNGNELTGESANIGFGRGGRSSICFLDEYAHVQHSEAVWASISDNSDCIIPVSTPNGKGNQFSWLRHESSIPVLSIHWAKHPKKNKDWYEKKKAQMKPHQIAQELDLSYEQSAAGKVYRRFDRKWHIGKEVIYPNPDYEQWVAWDFGIADPTAILWGQVTPSGIIQVWGCYELTDRDIDFFIPISKGSLPSEFDLLTEDQKRHLMFWLKKVPKGHTANHYGDNSGTARTANSRRSCRAAMDEKGIKLHSSGKQTFDWRIECVDNLLRLRNNPSRNEWYSIVEVSPDCQKFIDAMNNYEYDSDPDKLNDEKLKPKHNWASHMVSAFEFLAINRFPLRESTGFREERIR
jgi:hypothetical protein